MPQRFSSFREFYPFYLSEHRNPTCRLLHFFGSWAVLLALALIFVTRRWWGFLPLPILGYLPAWVGHFFFEKNRPATFRHPVYSLMGDWRMFFDILRRRRLIF